MSTDFAYLIFSVAALGVFSKLRAELAVLIVFLGGWLLLPVGHYPAGSAQATFAFWIVGSALPSDMLLTKAWVAPLAALCGALVFDRRSFPAWRPGWVDAPMVMWCCWPLVQALMVETTAPQGGSASAYLWGSWGTTWLLGRIYFFRPSSQLLLLQGLIWSVVACVPIAVIEGTTGDSVYGHLFEPHPFRFDGSVRYQGFRPLGFFENGNQYGLWVSLCALAAVWWVLSLRKRQAIAEPTNLITKVGAAVCVLVAVAAQSMGALLLAASGAAVLSVSRLIRPRLLAFGLTGALLVTSLVYVSGVIPITQIGKGSDFGQRVVSAFRAVGRGSFTWRISQDQKLLPAVKANLLIGSGQWDWWREKNTRPWGLAMLLLGQYGLVGLTLCFGCVLWPALREAWRAPLASAWRVDGMPLVLALIVGLTMLDALMNSFIFFPAVLIAGSLAGLRKTRA